MNYNYHENLPSNWSTLSISPNLNLMGMPFFFSSNTSILQKNARGLAETPLKGEGFEWAFNICLCAEFNTKLDEKENVVK